MRDGAHRRDRRELERVLKAVAAYDLVSGSRKLDGLGRGVRKTDVELRIGLAGGVRRTMRCILVWLVERGGGKRHILACHIGEGGGLRPRKTMPCSTVLLVSVFTVSFVSLISIQLPVQPLCRPLATCHCHSQRLSALTRRECEDSVLESSHNQWTFGLQDGQTCFWRVEPLPWTLRTI